MNRARGNGAGGSRPRRASRRDGSARPATSAATAPEAWVLRLYVTGAGPASVSAIEQVRAYCEAHLHGRYELEVIDLYQLPALAKNDQIVATPTLVRVSPAPHRRFIGRGIDMRLFSGVATGRVQ